MENQDSNDSEFQNSQNNFQPPAQPYGYPPHYYPPKPPNDDKAILAMVLGIISIVGGCAPLGPFAWYIGHKSRERIKASNGALDGETYATIGFVCGIIGTVLFVLSIAWIFIWFFIVGSSLFFAV